MRHFAHDTPSDLDRRILAGQTNEQIRAALGPLNKDVLYRCRKKRGGGPFALAADDVLSCLLCGTNSEQESYYDALLGVRVEM